jgi:hypothetical protein
LTPFEKKGQEGNKNGGIALYLHRDAKSGGTSAIEASFIALGLH